MSILDQYEEKILWEAQPSGLWQRLLTKLHLNFTRYQITKDELIIIKGFFKKTHDSLELYTLKDPDMIETLYQRCLKISTIQLTIDAHICHEHIENPIVQIKNIKDGAKVRKLLRDLIEENVKERGIQYFDRV